MRRGVETCLNVRTLRKGALVLFCLLQLVRLVGGLPGAVTTGALNGMSLVKVSNVLLEEESLLFRDGGLSRGRFASGAYLGGPPS